MKEKQLGEKIKEARIAANLTQHTLAEMVFVTESYIALIESGKRNPSTAVLSKLSEVLGLTTDRMLFAPSARTVDSYTLDFQKLCENRRPEEIETALRMMEQYFACLDALQEGSPEAE